MKNIKKLQKNTKFPEKSETSKFIINKYKNKYFIKTNIINLKKISHIKISNNKAKNYNFFAKNQEKSESSKKDINLPNINKYINYISFFRKVRVI